MRPGISRAVPMGILGFLLGALIVFILRWLQGLDPIWAVGPGLTLSVFMSAGFFVWGIGGFDPRLSVHGEAAEAEEEHEEEPKPAALLSSTIWQLTTLLLAGVLILAFVAWLPGGPTLTITANPVASFAGIGYFDVNLFGQEFQVSQLVVFAIFFIWLMLSLLVAAGAIGYLFFSLSRGITIAQATPYEPLNTQLFELPAPPAADEPTRRQIPPMLVLSAFVVIFAVVYFIFAQVLFPPLFPGEPDVGIDLAIAIGLLAAAAIVRPKSILMPLAIFGALFFILYPLLYYILIGWVYTAVFPGFISQELQRVAASVLSALIIPLILLRPKFVTFVIGRVARILARVLRWVGNVR